MLSKLNLVAGVHRVLIISTAVVWSLPSVAQERIYRCGNEYTNNATVAKDKGCKLMEGGNITVIQGPSPQAAPRAAVSSAPRSAPRSDSPEQRSRDSDARQILELELRKAEERLAQAQKAYANGQPEKEGIESRNHQRYLDRVAELKAAVSRAEADVNGLRRELARMGGAPVAPPAGPGPAVPAPAGASGSPDPVAK
ncbi:hypothetical protein [Hydrogenophaga pseudoflava]|uniref:hypothetical protein n=1 Tax=Hydrogenophaga pseudoflava TaxID=47421 RepID=UPI0027E4DDCB|nr:hypothetical protein [Hydrogenophaga pseudoflava]MDQ7745684.1 hypothetical protein [Hydrogenophaga pseudoflava]